MQSHTERAGNTVGYTEVRLVERALQRERCEDSATRMVFVTDGCPKQTHKAIAQELIDGAFIPMDCLQSECKEAIEQPMHRLRSDFLGSRGGVGKVTEEYRHLLAFAFQGTAGGEDFLSQVLWGIDQGLRLWGRRCLWESAKAPSTRSWPGLPKTGW